MTHGFLQRSLACLLIVSLIVIGGVAAAQSLNHESQHSHHQKTTHGTVLCSWMCAAGQVLDSSAAPYLIEHSPVAVVEQLACQLVPRPILDSPTSRGPPSHSI
ncbi:MAG TPA: hypothetical protein VFD86_07340 [Nitrospira sp.]|jgi:hypothetical protein|nr:hypothetical protein [Nitrospira sp.]